MGYITNSGSRVWSRIVSSLWRLSYEQDNPRFEFQQGKEIFLFSKMSRPVLGLIQPPTHWIPGFFPWPKKLGCDVYYIPPSSAKVENDWLYSTAPVSLHGPDWDWMEQGYPWEANGHSSSQEILLAFKLKVSYCVHNSLPLYPIIGLETKKKVTWNSISLSKAVM